MRTRLGQNFLVDRRAVARIVELLAPGDLPLLEIGPGRGALTAPLIEAAGRIAAVELDRNLARSLRERWDDTRLVLFEEDVLRLDLAAVSETLDPDGGRPLIVAGNLPYEVSKPIVQKLVRERGRVARAVLMFQREVADRLLARPGSRAYGPLSVLVGETFEVTRGFDLPPGAFRPRPKVFSTVTCWRRRAEDRLDEAAEQALRAALAACFARRRQTLRNNLRPALGAEAADSLLERAGIDGGRRAEQLTPAEFRRLAALGFGDRAG